MTGPRFFTPDYVEHAVLRDGTKVRLRLIRPDDRELLRAGFERLSSESRYARFFAPKTSLSDDELRYLSELDHEDHFAVGAVRDDDGPDEVGLGIARFIRLADPPNTAEAAIAVTDEAQHKGLGKLLLLRLVAAATERGIERFRSEVLGSNASIAALIAQIAPDHSVETRSGVMSIDIPLPEIAATQPAADEPLHSPIYRLFRAAAQNATLWTDAVRKLWQR
jgi:GNAT superfamily N-acetyltransferase